LTEFDSGVLATLRDTSYGREYDEVLELAAALLDGLSEQPEYDSGIVCEWLGSHVPIFFR
jgi:hypothetical protein